MSAHLQFGPEWMRKGPGKQSTTPTNESPSSSALSPIDPSPSPSASSFAGSTPASHASAKGSLSQGSVRRNLGHLNVGPAPVTPSTPAASPGTVSFAAAASGQSSQSPNVSSLHSQQSTSVPAPAMSLDRSQSELETSRYSKRLLSLYSTERGPKGAQAALDSPTAAAALANNGISGLSSHAHHSPQQSRANKKSFAFGSDREGGRRTASVNADLSGGHSNGLIGGAGAAGHGGHAGGIGGGVPVGNGGGSRAFSLSSNLHEMPDSRRPGLFQRGSATSAASAAANQAGMFPSTHRERERSATGIQGGVLGGVAPQQRKSKESDSSASTAATATQQLSARQPLTQAGGEQKNVRHTRVSHGPDGQPVSRDEWIRLRQERHPGEGPIGPPSDHSGGFTRGFEKQVAGTSSSLLSPQSHSQESASRFFDAASRGKNGELDTSVDLSHHAASLVSALNLDGEEDVARAAATQEAPPRAAVVDEQPSITPWSPETAEWLYRDPSGQVQGPFKATMMQDWYTAKYFTDDLLVRRAEVEEFQPLGKVLQLIGNLSTPFLVAPSQYAVAAAASFFPSAHAVQPQNDAQALPSPFLNRTIPSSQTGSIPSWNNAGNGVASFTDFGLSNGLTHDLGSNGVGNARSPFIQHNPALMQNFGAPNHRSPFGTPTAAYSDLSLDAGQQQISQNDYLSMIRQHELVERQRAIEEQRRGQMQAAAAAAAMAQNRVDPSILHSNWNQQHQFDNPVRTNGGFGQPSGGMDWNVPLGHQEQRQQPMHEQSRISPGIEHPPLQFTDPSVSPEQRAQVNSLVSPEAFHAPLTAEFPSEPSPEKPEDLSTSQTADAPAVQEVAVDEKEEDVSPEHLWPQSPKAVEFASEEQAFSIPSARDAKEGEELTPVKGKKSRKGKKGASVADSASQPLAQLSTPAASAVVDSDDGSAAATTPSAKVAPWAGAQQESNGLSLRAIQDAEVRKAEMAAKAGRQRLFQTSSSSAANSDSPVSVSWGLAMPSSRETQTQQTSNGGSTTPAWNASSTQPKKTLTEIQQEEERRQRRAAAATASANAVPSTASAQSMATSNVARAPRGYADSAGRASSTPQTQQSSAGGFSALSPPPSSSGVGGWSVVGSGGKANAPTGAPASTASVPAPRPVPTQVRSVSSQLTPSSASPSPEFIRYVKEQLRSLNSIKADEFIEMLLSFPLDPTPDVVEIIAESVYAASSTLDGRRFAADFVARRKLDAAHGRSSNGASGAPGSYAALNGPASGHQTAATAKPAVARTASDVLQQAAPKSADQFGGFKVVKAKGTKKRA